MQPKIAKKSDFHPGMAMIASWVFGIMIPSMVLTLIATRHWILSLASAFVIPLLAIAQGALGILTYRMYFGDAPLPITPSHGVVKVRPCSSDNEKESRHQFRQNDSLRSSSSLSSDSFQRYTDESKMDMPKRKSIRDQGVPLRLLVIGDSLAIGVGQSVSCTPILPEVVAKTLSKRFNGRTVYWTCHGAPGASTGWIVRELERAGSQRSKAKFIDAEESHQPEILNDDYWSDTECSTSDESSMSSIDESSVHQHQGFVTRESAIIDETRIWRDRLAQHSNRFGKSEVLGPYDVVIVITGSNDMKSAFFPFLLDREGAEFRRQAAERGGNFHLELRILLETLHNKMRRLQIRANLVRENVLKNVEETMERIIHLSPKAGTKSSSLSLSKSRKHHSTCILNQNIAAENLELRTFEEHEQVNRIQTAVQPDRTVGSLPLVVLPGFPVRSAPIFQSAPLRWLAVPIFDIMDMDKRKLAASDDHNVLFIPAPSTYDLVSYENKAGEFWKQKCEEEVILSLHDVSRRDFQRLQRDLRAYYSSKGKGDTAATSNRRTTALSYLNSFVRPGRQPRNGLFSIDSIHANDLGYDCWGRHLANAIADQLLRQECIKETSPVRNFNN